MLQSTDGLRRPQQQRSRESLERILRAAERLLATRGYDGLTIAEVGRKANVSTGSVYGRFASKDALVFEIHRRMSERLGRRQARRRELAADADLLTAVDDAVRSWADGLDHERALLRAFMLRGPVDPEIKARSSAALHDACDAFATTLLLRADEIRHPDPELAAHVAFHMVHDVLARHVVFGAGFESPAQRTWGELVDELVTASVAYLRSDHR